ncbi:helix-turn-helix transcriptional regulator [Telmatobacter sp. DSM 110680]|uniref:Helix-turn-helix transcriptional regulator n=1 Tax=Telmatobacter sp. DSM 110680 TaxID=3036704 RepID=A0AAU7DQR5_9BACT
MPDFSAFFVALGTRVRKLRKKRGLSQEDMIPLGFSARHWQQIEAGRPITMTTLLKVCHALEVPLSEMLAGFDRLLPKNDKDSE